MIGSCRRLGRTVFEQWMTNCENAHTLIEHTEIYQWVDIKLRLCDGLENAGISCRNGTRLCENIFLKPFPSAQAALDAAFDKSARTPTVSNALWALRCLCDEIIKCLKGRKIMDAKRITKAAQ